MAKPYSDDLRARVAASVTGGRTCRTTAVLFGVSVASAVKWSQHLRATSSAAAKPFPGRPRAGVLSTERDWLLARIKEAPDLTLRGLAAELCERGTVVSHWTVWKLFASEKITFKKSILPSEQDRPDVARRRERRIRLQKQLDPARLVFIDETWAKTNMTRTRGRILCGQRLHAKVTISRYGGHLD